IAVPHSATIRRVDVKRQIDLEVRHAGQQVVAKDASTLAVEEPADKQLDFAALRSDLMEEMLVRCEQVEETDYGVYQPLFRPLTLSKAGRPIAVGPSAFPRVAFRSTSRLSSAPTPRMG